MSLRQRVEDAFLIQFADNERLLTAERVGGKDATLIAKYEALRAELMPIVTEIVAKRGEGDGRVAAEA
jgi:hypothetical protein